MILDSSAIIAIVFREARYEDIVATLHRERARAIGAPSLAETGLVLTAKLGTNAIGLLSRFTQELEILTVPFGEDHWREAVDAYDRFGRGRHAASLNFGDCMTYAVAKLSREPLLCTGKDFAKTDLVLA